jgi:hypothetical protein
MRCRPVHRATLGQVQPLKLRVKVRVKVQMKPDLKSHLKPNLEQCLGHRRMACPMHSPASCPVGPGCCTCSG